MIFSKYAVLSLLRSLRQTLPYLWRWGDHRKKVTENYPDPISCKTFNDLPVRSRGLLFNDIELCTGCGACQKICPTRAIHLELQPGATEQKIWVSQFDVDFGWCLFCGLCVEACEPGSLVHTKHYEAAAYTGQDLIGHFGRGHITPEQQQKWSALRKAQEERDPQEDFSF